MTVLGRRSQHGGDFKRRFRYRQATMPAEAEPGERASALPETPGKLVLEGFGAPG